MNSHSCFLAVDSGTSKMKVALIDEQNKFIDLVTADLQVLHPFDGASEADMDKTWTTLCLLFNQLAQRNPAHWDQIIAIGVTGQGDGAWMVDRAGNPARNAILWNDTRTKFTKIDQKASLDLYCQENSITPIFQGANYYILKWVKENEPEVFNHIASVIHCKDWLNYKLTGTLATDFSDTSTAMLRSSSMSYDFKVLEFLGLQGSENLFAPIHYSDEIIGKVSNSAAVQTGLHPGIPVVIGSIDITAAAAGAGATEIGDTVAILGTTCCVTTVLQRNQLDYRDRRGSILCHQSRDRYLRLIAMSNGMASLDWVCETMLPDASFEDIEEGIRGIEIGSEGVIFQPYLFGERAPFRDPNATGGFLGITARHTPYHLVHAAYEGLALALTQCYEILPEPNDHIRIAGGGAANNVLCQMISDCFGKEIRRSKIAELGLNGIVKAIRKGAGMAEVESTTLADEDLFCPDPIKHKRYMELLHLFQSTLQAMEPWWEARDNFLKLRKS